MFEISDTDTLPARAATDLDFRYGAAIPGEEEAFSAYNALKAERTQPGTIPPARLPQLRTQLRTYTQTARSHNRPLFPSQTRQGLEKQIQHSEKLLSGLDKLAEVLTPEQNAALETRAKLSGDPESYRARAVNSQLLSSIYGAPVKPEAYARTRDHYARTVLKSPVVLDDKAFYSALQSRKQQHADVSAKIGTVATTLAKDIAKGTPQTREAYLAQFADLDDDNKYAVKNELALKRRQLLELRRQVTPFANALMQHTLIRAGRDDAYDAVKLPGAKAKLPSNEAEAVKRLNELPEAQRSMVIAILSEANAKMPADPRGVGERAAMGITNTAERMGKGSLDFLETLVVRGTNFEGGKTDWTRNQDQALRGAQLLRNLQSPYAEISKPSDSWYTKSFLFATEQLPYMIAASSGVGTALLATSMGGDSYANARIQTPEANPDLQFVAGAASGAAQAVIERASLKVFSGVVKGAGKLSNFLTGKYGTEAALRLAGITNRFARGAAGAVAGAASVAATEYAEEIAQDVTNAALQDLATEMSGIDSTTDYRALLAAWAPNTPQGSRLALSLIPYALIGGAGASFHHFRQGEILAKNTAALRSIGIPEAEIQKIVTSPDIASADAAMQTAWTEAADEKIALAQSQAAADARNTLQQMLADNENLAAAAGFQIIAQEEILGENGMEDTFTLSLPDGEQQIFSTRDAAESALFDYIQENRDLAADATHEALTTDMVEFLKGEFQAGQDVTVNEQNFEGSYENLVKNGLASMDQLQARLELFATEQGMTMPQLQKAIREKRLDVRVMARSYSKTLRDGSTKYMVDLFQGADPLNAAEDFAESHWSYLMDQGIMTSSDLIGYLRETEAATGNSYLRADITPDNYNHADHRGNLIEALSKASIQYMLGESRSDQLPAGFRTWIEQMILALGKAWTWAKQLMNSAQLREAIEEGMINPKFVAQLADSVGMNESARQSRAQKAYEEQSRAEMLADLPKFSDRIKGRLMHPAKAKEINSPFAGELQRLYDNLLVEGSTRWKNGKRKTYNQAATTYFAPRSETVDLDALRESLAEEGFTGLDTIADMLAMAEEVMTIEKVEYYATHSGIATQNENFSLSAITGSRLESLLAQKATQGPLDRAEIMEGIRNRLQAAQFRIEARETDNLSDHERKMLGWRARKDLSPAETERLRIEDALAQVKAVLNSVPPEIRSRILVPMNRILDANTELTSANAFAELIENLDDELEFHLREEYTEAIARILDIAQPTVSESRQSKGKLTIEANRLIALIESIREKDALQIALDLQATDSALAELENQLNAIDETAEPETYSALKAKQAETQEFQQLLYHFGAIGAKDSRELFQSLKILRDIYTKGRFARNILDDDRRQYVARMRKDVRMSLELPHGTTGPQHAAATRRPQTLKGNAFNLMSIHDMLEVMFPYSMFARDAQERLIAAQRAVTRDRLAARDRLSTFMTAKFGTQNVWQERRKLLELSQPLKWKTQIAEVAKTVAEKIPVDHAKSILDGTMKVGWETERDTMALLRQAYRDYQALPPKNRERTKFIRITRVAARKPLGALDMSALDALYVIQLSKQEEYLPSLTTFGFTPEVVDQMKAELVELNQADVFTMGEFYASEYESNWQPMNEVYQRLYHMTMPQIRNYTPGAFDNSQSNGSNIVGDPMGDSAPMTALSFGATKNRRAHRSRPKQYSAHSVYMAHIDRSTYWQHFAEVARDLGTIFRETETYRAIEVRHGKEAAAELLTAIENIEKDGAQDAAGRLTATKTINNMIAGQAIVGLAFNFSVPFKQFSAALGSMWYMSPLDAIRSFSRALFQPEYFSKVWKSEAVQQRIREGFSPEDRAMLDASEITPSILFRLTNAGSLPSRYADAAFTTVSGVIAYQHQLQQSLAGGMSAASAEQSALSFMDTVIFRTAQPADTQTKSNFEIRAGVLGRLFTMFRSDPRKQMGFFINHTMRAMQGRYSKTKLAQEFATQWLAYGMAFYSFGAIFRLIAQDDDNPKPVWKWEDFLAAALIGPIEGAGVIASIGAAATKFALNVDQFNDSRNPLSAALMRSLQNLTSEDELTVKDWLTLGLDIGAAAAVFKPQYAIIPAMIRGGMQAANAVDNVVTSPQERIARLDAEYTAEATKQAKQTAKEIANLADDYAKMSENDRQAALAALDPDTRKKVEAKLAKKAEKDTTPEHIRKLKSMSAAERQKKIVYILANLPDAEKEAYLATLRTYGISSTGDR